MTGTDVVEPRPGDRPDIAGHRQCIRTKGLAITPPPTRDSVPHAAPRCRALARRALTLALDWFLPPLCLGCRRTPAAGIDALNLCPVCRRLPRPVPARRCRSCLTPILDPSAPVELVCGACRRRPPPWERLLAGWYYEPPLREVVRGLKYGRLEYLAAALADVLARRCAAELTDVGGVVAVPLHWRRQFARGYNQAELLAGALARRLDRPLLRSPLRGLVRHRATRAQTGLDRAARRRNLRRAFAWRGRRLEADGASWLLVDDVYTTGATLDSAARTLRRAGARRVIALVAAATPPPETRAPESPRRRTLGRRNP